MEAYATHICISYNPYHLSVITANKYTAACQDKKYKLVVTVTAAFNTIHHIMILWTLCFLVLPLATAVPCMTELNWR